jgi:hypothetical protein
MKIDKDVRAVSSLFAGREKISCRELRVHRLKSERPGNFKVEEIESISIHPETLEDGGGIDIYCHERPEEQGSKNRRS